MVNVAANSAKQHKKELEKLSFLELTGQSSEKERIFPQ